MQAEEEAGSGERLKKYRPGTVAGQGRRDERGAAPDSASGDKGGIESGQWQAGPGSDRPMAETGGEWPVRGKFSSSARRQLRRCSQAAGQGLVPVVLSVFLPHRCTRTCFASTMMYLAAPSVHPNRPTKPVPR
jgi:hypothetical protein